MKCSLLPSWCRQAEECTCHLSIGSTDRPCSVRDAWQPLTFQKPGRLRVVAGDEGAPEAENQHNHHPDDDDAAGTRTAADEQAHADATKEARRLVGRVPPAALIDRDPEDWHW